MTAEIPAVQISSLSYSYPDGTPALHNIGLCIRSGQRVALVGPNGAGKTTLLLHLCGVLLNPGAVTVCGMPVEKRNLMEIRRKTGYVFQQPDDQLFNLTVTDEVAFGPRNLGLNGVEIDERVRRSLVAVGLSGYEQRHTYQLSVGEKKRVALASVLSMDVELLALDEPAANLDPRGRRELGDLLRTLPQTQVIATHDLGLAAGLCDKAVVINKGRIVAEGPAGVILSSASLLRENGLA